MKLETRIIIGKKMYPIEGKEIKQRKKIWKYKQVVS